MFKLVDKLLLLLNKPFASLHCQIKHGGFVYYQEGCCLVRSKDEEGTIQLSFLRNTCIFRIHIFHEKFGIDFFNLYFLLQYS